MLRVFFSFIFLLASYISICQTKEDTIATNVESVKKSLLIIEKKLNDTAANKTGKDCYLCKEALNRDQKLIVLSPVILFLILTAYTVYRLRKENFKLSDALAESNPRTTTVPNPDFDKTAPVSVANPNTISVTDYPKSTSRVIAFFTGLATLAITVCTTSYYFYMYLKTGASPNLENMYNILIMFGIGVTPYAVNKVSDSMKTNP
jgi:hypothetical protein